jgi:hypothetical protein
MGRVYAFPRFREAAAYVVVTAAIIGLAARERLWRHPRKASFRGSSRTQRATIGAAARPVKWFGWFGF